MIEILGQSNAISLLHRSSSDGRRHHAWIFSGPRGVGKCTTAVKFAAEILGVPEDAVESHPDLHIIRKEDVVWSQNPQLRRRKQTNIPLDLLRERMIGGRTSDDKNHAAIAYKTPCQSKDKLFLIDEAELLDESGQNALLKTLEEPPPRTTIILVTCRDDLLLPTIQSRCQTITFSPLDSNTMNTWAETKPFDDVDPLDLSWAIDFSCGSPGLTCLALQTDLPSLASSIARFIDMQQSDYTSATTKIIEYVENTVSQMIKDNPNASKEASNRKAIELVLLMFGHAAKEKIRGNDVDRGISAANIISDIERQLTTNISMKVLLESLAARWAYLCVGDSVFM